MNEAVPTAGAELVPLQAELQGWSCAAVLGVGCCALPARCTWQCCEAQPRKPWINNSHGFAQVYLALEVQKSWVFFFL